MCTYTGSLFYFKSSKEELKIPRKKGPPGIHYFYLKSSKEELKIPRKKGPPCVHYFYLKSSKEELKIPRKKGPPCVHYFYLKSSKEELKIPRKIIWMRAGIRRKTYTGVLFQIFLPQDRVFKENTTILRAQKNYLPPGQFFSNCFQRNTRGTLFQIVFRTIEPEEDSSGKQCGGSPPYF